MAAPTFVAWANTAGATLVEPTGTADGDTILAIVNSTTTPTGPSGWAQVGSSRTAGGEIATAWSIVRGASAPALTWSGSIDGGLLTTIRGAAATFDASAQSAAGSAVSPSVTTTVPDCLIVSLYADAASTSITAPAGMTLTDGFFDASAYVVQASTGATGTKTWGGTGTPIGAWTIALKSDGIDFTASETVTAGATAGDLTAGDLTVGMTAAETITAAGPGTLDVISRVFSGSLEVELTTGVWTDITNRIAFPRAPLQIRQGRSTEYDDVTGGVLTVQLYNDDGALMPDNTGSAYYPNWVEGQRIRWRVSKSGTTWTRFVGWIQAIEPDFPDSSTTGSTVAVTAVDALGLIAQRRLRSCWTEAALALARASAVTVDALEATGSTSGWVATMTNYSTDAGALNGTYAFAGTVPNLSFGSDRDVSCGQIVTSSPDSLGQVNKTLPRVQADQKCIQWLLRMPSNVPAAGGKWFISSPHPTSSATGIQIVVEHNGASDMRLIVMDVNGTTTLGTLHNPVGHGQWYLITLAENTGNTSRLDVTATQLSNGTTATVSSVNFDIKTLRQVEFPTSTGATSAAAFGGVIALGQRTGLSYLDATPTGAQGTLSSRLDDLFAALSTLPVTLAKVGSLSTQVLTGQWAGRYGLEILQELVRSGRAIAWARSRDSVVHAIDVASLRPASLLATIDTEADCAGPPRLTRSVDSRPTRIQVDSPGRSLVVVDSTAEAGPGSPQRSKTVSTVCSASADMTSLANLLLTTHAGTRIKSITVDLVTGATDHTAAFFSEASTLSGLFPTCRIRTTVPASHFGTTTKDHYVQGWVERYHPRYVTVEMDTSPATGATLVFYSWPGETGDPWPAAWVEGSTASGGSSTIQGNRGRLSCGTAAAVGAVRRIDGMTFADGEIVCSVQLGAAHGYAMIGYRSDAGTASVSTYYVRISATGDGLKIGKSVASTPTVLGTSSMSLSAGVLYQVRVRAVGTQHQARLWDASVTEPSTWDITVTDATYASGALNLQAANGPSGSGGYVDFDDYAVTTE
jgi:hypothetical protein